MIRRCEIEIVATDTIFLYVIQNVNKIMKIIAYVLPLYFDGYVANEPVRQMLLCTNMSSAYVL